jgi:hypothetical protein
VEHEEIVSIGGSPVATLGGGSLVGLLDKGTQEIVVKSADGRARTLHRR